MRFYEKLKKDFPELFRNPMISCSVPKGWEALVYDLCEKIYTLSKDVPEDERVFVVQIKEKFGGLRFYTHQEIKEISELITEAEDKSYKLCMECSGPAQPDYENVWVKTICEKCKK